MMSRMLENLDTETTQFAIDWIQSIIEAAKAPKGVMGGILLGLAIKLSVQEGVKKSDWMELCKSTYDLVERKNAA